MVKGGFYFEVLSSEFLADCSVELAGCVFLVGLLVVSGVVVLSSFSLLFASPSSTIVSRLLGSLVNSRKLAGSLLKNFRTFDGNSINVCWASRMIFKDD